MDDNLHALEAWAGALLNRLSDQARKRLNTQIGRELRRRQQQRIAAQRNPDGSAYAPRSTTWKRDKKGRIKLFAKLRQARNLKVMSDASQISVGFTGRASRIARVHQYGLSDRPSPGQPAVRYPQRQLLGLTDADLTFIRDQLIDQLAGSN